MCYEGFDGVSDCYVVNQQDWVDSEEIKQGNQFICVYVEVFFYYFGDVFVWVFFGEYEVGYVVVGEESYWEGQNCYDDQGDYVVNVGVDWQE